VWSPVSDPDKEQLAAVQQNPDGDQETVSLVPAFGGKPKVLFGASTLSCTWSPDGSQLAVAGINFGGAPKPVSGILLFSSDGTPLQQPPLAVLQSATAGPDSPSYSPDSVHLVFDMLASTKLGNQLPVGLAQTSTSPSSPPQIILRGPAHDPQFSPDGGSLSFLAPSPSDPNTETLYVGAGSAQPAPLLAPPAAVTSAYWSPALPKKQ